MLLPVARSSPLATRPARAAAAVSTAAAGTQAQAHQAGAGVASSSSSSSGGSEEVSELWHFRDTEAQVHGPFGAAQMRAWYQAGYFME